MGIWIVPSLQYQGSDARALLTWVGRLRVPDSALTRVIWLVIREAVKPFMASTPCRRNQSA